MTPEFQDLYDVVEKAYNRYGFKLVDEPYGHVHTCDISSSSNYDISVCIHTEIPYTHVAFTDICDDIRREFEEMGYTIAKTEYFFSFYFIYLNRNEA